jgi:hypothetical protein
LRFVKEHKEHEGSGAAPPKKKSIFVPIFGRFFSTWFFTNGFLFLVKELGLLTNPSHWIRVLDALDPICILYCKQCMIRMNIEYVGFPNLGFQGKNLCNVCIFHCIFYVLLLKICLQ